MLLEGGQGRSSLFQINNKGHLDHTHILTSEGQYMSRLMVPGQLKCPYLFVLDVNSGTRDCMTRSDDAFRSIIMCSSPPPLSFY